MIRETRSPEPVTLRISPPPRVGVSAMPPKIMSGTSVKVREYRKQPAGNAGPSVTLMLTVSYPFTARPGPMMPKKPIVSEFAVAAKSRPGAVGPSAVGVGGGPHSQVEDVRGAGGGRHVDYKVMEADKEIEWSSVRLRTKPGVTVQGKSERGRPVVDGHSADVDRLGTQTT